MSQVKKWNRKSMRRQAYRSRSSTSFQIAIRDLPQKLININEQSNEYIKDLMKKFIYPNWMIGIVFSYMNIVDKGMTRNNKLTFSVMISCNGCDKIIWFNDNYWKNKNRYVYSGSQKTLIPVCSRKCYKKSKQWTLTH